MAIVTRVTTDGLIAFALAGFQRRIRRLDHLHTLFPPRQLVRQLIAAMVFAGLAILNTIPQRGLLEQFRDLSLETGRFGPHPP